MQPEGEPVVIYLIIDISERGLSDRTHGLQPEMTPRESDLVISLQGHLIICDVSTELNCKIIIMRTICS